MKFSIAKLQKTFKKHLKKKLKGKTKKQQQTIKPNRGKKSKYKSLFTMEKFHHLANC